MSWIPIAVLVLIAGYVVLTFNALVRLKNIVANAWKQIDVQLQRRHDLIPNLVEAVRGFMQYEQETLERVVQARAKAVSASGVQAKAQAEGELTQALGRLFALAENYPQLRANENVLRLQEELTTTENQIAFARQFYNDMVMRFNLKQQVFPSNLFARLLGFREAPYFEAPVQAREVPKVDLSLRRGSSPSG
jgi:LemA protein